MAMVTLSERSVSYFPKQNFKHKSAEHSVIVPKLHSSKGQTKKGVHPPFNSTCSRQVSEKIEASPGPGSYDDPLAMKPKEPFCSKKKNQFISRQERFLEGNEDFPGPGSYNIAKSLDHKSSRSCSDIHRPISVRVSSNSLSNVSTIPSKDHVYGYIYNEEGSLVAVEDPERVEGFLGVKDNSVGPGRYNPIINRPNNIVRWDKMSSRKLEREKSTTTIDSIIERKNTDITFKIENNILNTIEHKNNKIKSSKNCVLDQRVMFKKVSDIRKKLLGNVSFKVNKEYLSNKKVNGLAEEKSLSLLNIKKKPIKYALNFNNLRYHYKPGGFQCFLSGSSKDLSYLSKENNINVGPGSYFKHQYQSLSRSKSMIYHPIILKTIKKKKEPEASLGPSSYNINRSLIKKSYSRLNTGFGIEKRFYELENNPKSSDPGPGSYIGHETWSPQKITMKNDQFVRLGVDIMKRKEDVNDSPGCNAYQPPNVVNIIEQENKAKCISKNYGIAPFNSEEQRFRREQTETNPMNGPGRYFRDIFEPKKRSFQTKKIPFGASQKKDVSLKLNKDKLGPGCYLHDNYFDWNKKSYNVMFI